MARLPVKTVAIKFCGGCNPTFDRVRFWDQVKAASNGAIQWVCPDGPDAGAMLLICGCHSSCPEKNYDPVDFSPFVVVRDEGLRPEQIVQQIMKERER